MLIALGKTEKARFHSVGEDYEKESHIGVHIGDNAVAARLGRELGGVERHEEIVEEASDDAAHAIDGGFLSE